VKTAIGPFGKGTSLNYDQRLVTIGQDLAYITPEGGKYTFVEDANGDYVNSAYPFLAKARAVRNADKTKTLTFEGGSTYTFDPSGWLVEVADRNGNAVQISRDSGGHMTDISDTFGRSLIINTTTRTISSTTYTLISSMKDDISDAAIRREIQYEYDSAARLLSVSSLHDFSKMEYGYTSAGIVNSITRYEDTRDTNEPGITEVINVYDAAKRVTNQTQANTGQFVFNYTEANGLVNAVTSTNPRSHDTTYRYNSDSYLIEEVDSTLRSTVYQRAAGTNELNEMSLYSDTGELLHSTSYTYDNGLVNSVTDPAGNITYYEYGLANIPQPTLIRDALQNETVFTYDANGNVTSILEPGQSTATGITYNSVGLVNTVTNALSNTVSFDYYSSGQIANITGPYGTTSYGYDAIGRVSSITDPENRTTSYIYNTPDREVQITDGLNRTVTVVYNSKGDVRSVTDAKGQTVSYTIDERFRPDSMTDHVSDVESYGYNLNDNLVSVTDRKGQISNVPEPGGYDKLDRLLRMDYDDGSSTSYAYNEVGLMNSVTDSITGTIDFVYTDPATDAYADMVKQVTSQQGTVSYTYDELGRRTGMDVEAQLVVGYDYEANGLVNSISTTNPVTSAPMDFVFSYDDAGRRTGLTYPNGVTAAYVYDEAGRIESIAYKNAALQVIERVGYAYNAAGERTSLDRLNIDPLVPAITNSTYPALPHANRMDTFNGEAVLYDDNGNMTQKGTMTLAWDVRDRLVGLSGSQSASFLYDALGRRIEKTISGVTTQYLYDGLDIAVEKDGVGAVKAWYVRTLNIDEPLARIEADGTVRYYHVDALGSIIALTDENGVVKTQYNYSPYGETVVIGEPSGNPFQYTGRENDGTGLYAYRARYYSPEMRSFISEDPIRFAGGMNWYSYVGNRPVNFVDPMGLDEWSFHPYDHDWGGTRGIRNPHFQRTRNGIQERYDAWTLRPMTTLKRTPSELSATERKQLLNSRAVKRAMKFFRLQGRGTPPLALLFFLYEYDLNQNAASLEELLSNLGMSPDDIERLLKQLEREQGPPLGICHKK
jgi:RHS repeat-associated protein